MKFYLIFVLAISCCGLANANPLLDVVNGIYNIVKDIFQGPEVDSIVLNTQLGSIKGRKLVSQYGTAYVNFRSVRFAQPAKRFKLAEEITTSWNGTYDATKESNMCYQVNPDLSSMSEDCLFLSINVPMECLPTQSNPTPKCPTLLFYYGGALFYGNNQAKYYSPDNFIREGGLIVVLANYRLGIFGFVSDPEGIIPKNIGLKDAIKAAKWVHIHIADYGGDPSKVTANGQSAGSALVSYMVQSPLVKNKGYFQRAIMQSSNVLTPWTYQRNPIEVFDKVVRSVPGCGTLTFLKLVDAVKCLKKVTAASLTVGSGIDAIVSWGLKMGYLNGLNIAIVKENETEGAAVTEYSYEALSQGHFPDDISILTGITSEEALLFSLLFHSGNAANLWNEYKLVPDNMYVNGAIDKETVSKLILEKYFDGSRLGMFNHRNIVLYASDTAFNVANREYLTKIKSKAPTYCYQFSYSSRNNIVGTISAGGGVEKAGHTDDQLYLWIMNATDIAGSLGLTTKEDKEMRIVMTRLWTNFAKSGNPTPISDSIFNGFIWPLANSESAGGTQVVCANLNSTLSILRNPKEDRYQFWHNLYTVYGNPKDTY